jgi:transcriptional regulator with GAF, ATPase, and Fis domain
VTESSSGPENLRSEATGTSSRITLVERRYPRVTWHESSQTLEIVLRTPLVIGSARSADLVLVNNTVSRIHAELDPRHDGLWVRDLDSKNGTFVDGMRVKETCVQQSADIQMGTSVLHVDFDAGMVAPVELWSTNHFQHLVGQSTVMRELFALLYRVARTDASVLIRGETGTGKEVVARSIHDASHRRDKPYVVVDCAALPENLLEAELFGHTKGAFTGAVSARVGAIESAEGGTVFLDEIGEVPLSMQPKLLRVLEQRTVRRIGETQHRPVDVRFITATHRDLLAMVARGEFREDLYFRLGVIPVSVPPLRSRREDIALLVDRFVGNEKLSSALMEEIRGLPWRGNVRELRNFVERAKALGEAEVLRRSAAIVSSTRFDDERPSAVWRSAPPSSNTINRAAIPSLVEGGEEETSATPSSDGSTGAIPSERMPQVSSAPRGAHAVAFEGSFKLFRERWISAGESEFLRRLLERHGRNVAAVSEEAGVDRTYVYRLMRKYGL